VRAFEPCFPTRWAGLLPPCRDAVHIQFRILGSADYDGRQLAQALTADLLVFIEFEEKGSGKVRRKSYQRIRSGMNGCERKTNNKS
jgi:hypothetical protein